MRAASAVPVAAAPSVGACLRRGRPARVSGGPEPLGGGRTVARRDASNTELAALPAVVEWPSLKYL